MTISFPNLSAAHAITQRARLIMSRHIEGTISQVKLFAAVQEHPDESQTLLTEVTGIDRSTLADMVKRLVKKGFLLRKDDEKDARCYKVRLSAEGAKWLHKNKAAIERAEEEFSSQVSGLDKVKVTPLEVEAADEKQPAKDKSKGGGSGKSKPSSGGGKSSTKKTKAPEAQAHA